MFKMEVEEKEKNGLVIVNGNMKIFIGIITAFLVPLIATAAAWGSLSTRVNRTEGDVADIPERMGILETKVDAIGDIPERMSILETKVDAIYDHIRKD